MIMLPGCQEANFNLDLLLPDGAPQGPKGPQGNPSTDSDGQRSYSIPANTPDKTFKEEFRLGLPGSSVNFPLGHLGPVWGKGSLCALMGAQGPGSPSWAPFPPSLGYC